MSSTLLRTAAAFALLVLGACGEPGDSGPEEPAQPGRTDHAALLVASCSGCHAPGGSAIVDLNRLEPGKIAASLNQYRSEPGGSTVMHRLAHGYTDEDVAAIVERLSEQRKQ
ncbi:MAG: hypothetical protein R3360_08440 [Alphaproteobacteria bacterium]|nr:hypothetical protein [Alphaproteobacteria bacterium]